MTTSQAAAAALAGLLSPLAWQIWPAEIGDGQGNVAGDREHFIKVRIAGSTIATDVYNVGGAPLVEGWHCLVGISPDRPTQMRLIALNDPRADDNPGGLVEPHSSQHYWLGHDQGFITWRQITDLLVRTNGDLTVTIYQGVIPRAGVDTEILTQVLDLTAYLPGSGALYALISVDVTGAIIVTPGSTKSGILDLKPADLPDTPMGNFALAAVRLYAGQTAIQENSSMIDIYDRRWPQERLASDPLLQFGPQGASQFFAGPYGYSGNPTFRSIYINDLPTTLAGKADLDPKGALFLTNTAISGIRYKSSTAYANTSLEELTQTGVTSGTLFDFEIGTSAVGADAIVAGLFKATFSARANWNGGSPPVDGYTNVLQEVQISVALVRRTAGAVETVLATTPLGAVLGGSLTSQVLVTAISELALASTDTLVLRFIATCTTFTNTLTVHYYNPDVTLGLQSTTFSRGEFPLVRQVITTAMSGDATITDAGVLTLGALPHDLSMGSHLITNLVDPVSSQDAATRSWVLALVGGGALYQGTWNASTNTPTIVSGVGTQGHYYFVSVAGTTMIDGVNTWQVGDMIIFNGSTWQKIIGSGSSVPTGSTTGDFMRWNAGTGHWEVAPEPIALKQLNLTPAAAALTDIEGALYYNSANKAVMVCTDI